MCCGINGSRALATLLSIILPQGSFKTRYSTVRITYDARAIGFQLIFSLRRRKHTDSSPGILDFWRIPFLWDRRRHISYQCYFSLSHCLSRKLIEDDIFDFPWKEASLYTFPWLRRSNEWIINCMYTSVSWLNKRAEQASWPVLAKTSMKQNIKHEKERLIFKHEL